MMRRILGVALLALPLFACDPAGNGSDKKPESLRDIEIPADFTFQTSAPVALQVAAAPELVANGGGALEVARPDGKVLYRGPLTSQPLNLELVLPSKDEQVHLTLTANGRQYAADVAVSNQGASHRFQ